MDRLNQKWMLFSASRRRPEAVARIQRQRLVKLVDYAKKHSPFYSRLYQDIPPGGLDLASLPPVNKNALMAEFDAWVNDPQVNLAELRRFLASRASPGQRYLDRYSVWATSGTTGEPGIFVHDDRARSVYTDLIIFRAYPNWFSLSQLIDLLRRGFRYTLVIATGGPYAGITNWEEIRLRLGRLANVLNTLSLDNPLPELVQRLNEIQPVVLASYPSVLGLLAEEQVSGSLRIRPNLLACTSEWLDPAVRGQIERAFAPARLVELYGASEFPCIATSCRHNWLHLNADWVILEPIDRAGRPVPPGQPSHSVLLTNLANFVQPIIRYDLGDSVTLRPDPCPCRSRLPALRVEGRRDEILVFPGKDGSPVRLLPMALADQVEKMPGVRRYQIIQTAASALQVRLEAEPGCDRLEVWTAARRSLEAFLSANQLIDVELSLAGELPRPEPGSGKFRLVWSQITDQQL
jgi:phenylacetate-coenzyme A ligase PaaK-like adenylate-forming protein